MSHGIRMSSRRGKRLAPMVTLAASAGLVLALSGQAAAAPATVTTDTGNAFGVSEVNVTLFGGTPFNFGPAPTITVPSGGSGGTKLTASATSENVTAGPATFFSSGPETVTTKGTVGATGSVQSTTSIKAAAQPAGTCAGTATKCVYAGPFTADTVGTTAGSVASTCKATAKAQTATTTIKGGKLVTATDTQGNPTTTVTIPTSPPKNDTISGFLYASPTDKESFTFVFNEQTVSGGTITVHAGHEELMGPTAKGDLYFGQSVCGVS